MLRIGKGNERRIGWGRTASAREAAESERNVGVCGEAIRLQQITTGANLKDQFHVRR